MFHLYSKGSGHSFYWDENKEIVFPMPSYDAYEGTEGFEDIGALIEDESGDITPMKSPIQIPIYNTVALPHIIRAIQQAAEIATREGFKVETGLIAIFTNTLFQLFADGVNMTLAVGEMPHDKEDDEKGDA